MIDSKPTKVDDVADGYDDNEAKEELHDSCFRKVFHAKVRPASCSEKCEECEACNERGVTCQLFDGITWQECHMCDNRKRNDGHHEV